MTRSGHLMIQPSRTVGLASTIGLAAATFTLIACAGDGEPSPVEQVGNSTDDASWEEYRDRARRTRNGSVYYVVESDIFFESENVLKRYYDVTHAPASALAIWRNPTTGVWPTFSTSEATHISYCVS